MARISYIGDSGEPLELVVGADNPEVMIGRHRSCAIRTSTQSVSRHHARVYFDGQSYWLQDNGSSNGTYYQNQRLTPQEPVAIDDGEFFMCGNFEMRFDLDEDDLAMLAEGEQVFDDTMDDVLVEYEDESEPLPEDVDATRFADLPDQLEPEDFADVGEDDWEYDDVPPPPTAAKAPIPPPPGIEAEPIPPPPGIDSAPVPAAAPPAGGISIDDLQDALKAANQEIDDRESKIQGLEIELESLGSRLEEIGGAEALPAMMTELETLRPLQAEVDGLRAELETAKASGGDARGELETLRAEAENLQSELEAARADAEHARGEADQAQAAAEQARADAAKAAEEAAANAGGAPAGRVEELEKELDEAQDDLEHANEKYEEARGGRRNAEELASLLRSQAEMYKQGADAAKAEVEGLKAQVAAAGSGGGADPAELAAANARATGAEKAAAASASRADKAEAEIERLEAELEAAQAGGGGGGADLSRVAELEHAVKEKDDQIAQLWAKVAAAEQQAAGASTSGDDVNAAVAARDAAMAEVEDLKAQMAAGGAGGDELAKVKDELAALREQYNEANDERDDLEHAAAANMKRMKKLMKELDEARNAAGAAGGGDDSGALKEEIALLRRELSAAEAARDEALASAGDGGGGDTAQLSAMINELNGTVSSFRSDFMQVTDAFDLIRSDDEDDRADGFQQMQEGLDACNGRSGELKQLIRGLKGAV